MPDKELTGLTPLAADFFEADPGFRTLIESLSPPDQKKRLPASFSHLGVILTFTRLKNQLKKFRIFKIQDYF